MFEAVRPYGSKGLPIAQDDEGRVIIGETPSTPVTPEIEVNIEAPSTLIFPSKPRLFIEDAETTLGQFLAGSNRIVLHYMRNLEETVELVGVVHGGNPEPGIYRSDDNGDSWTRISNPSYMRTGTVYSTGKSVINVAPKAGETRKTEIWFSETFDSDAEANWTKVADISSGYFSANYGHSIKDNVVVFTSYGDKDALNPPRHVYVSTDFGKTFVESEGRKIADMPDPAHFHLHDCEYDPYADRLWVSNGDQSNSNLQYSDDLGVTWTILDQNPLHYKQQPTAIIALPDRVLFLTDSSPDGVHFLKKDATNPKKPVEHKDIQLAYTPEGIPGSTPFKHVANNSRTDIASQTDVFPYCLFMVMNDAGSQGRVRLIASPDGKQFYTLFTYDGSKMLVGSLIGPVSNDPEGQVYFTYYDRDEGVSKQCKFKFPKWVQAMEA